MAQYKSRWNRRGGRSWGKSKGRAGARGPKKYFGGSRRKVAANREVAALRKEVDALTKGEKQKYTVQGYGPNLPFSAGSAADIAVQQCHMIVPVTEALLSMDLRLPMRMSEAYRRKRRVVVTGVTLTFKVAHRMSYAVSGLLYYPNSVGARATADRSADGMTSSFAVGNKLGSTSPPRMLTVEELGFVAQRDGPYETTVRRIDDGGESPPGLEFSLASADGSIFECPTRRREDGGPVGSVEWSIGSRGEPGYQKYKGCSTVNQVVSAPRQLVSSAIIPTVRHKMHWKLCETVEFSVEEATTTVMSRALQVAIMLRGLGDVDVGDHKVTSELVGYVTDVVCTIYWRCA
jgi:hypothetical protein